MGPSSRQAGRFSGRDLPHREVYTEKQVVAQEGKTVTILEHLCLVVCAEQWLYQYGLFVAEASRLMLGRKQQSLSICKSSCFIRCHCTLT